MEITKGKPVVFKQKIEKGIKAYHQKKNNQITKEDSKRGRKEQKNYQIVRK